MIHSKNVGRLLAFRRKAYLCTVKRLYPLLFFLTGTLCVAAQERLTGTVTDAASGEPLPQVSVFYEDTKTLVYTDDRGHYALPRRKGYLIFSCVGYDRRRVFVKTDQWLNVRLESLDNRLGEARVQGKRRKYSRKNNPAVELMQRVIAHKNAYVLRSRDYCSRRRNARLDFAFYDVSDSLFARGALHRLAFLKDYVETGVTGKRILPISTEETAEELLFRRTPRQDKSILQGRRQRGLNDFFQTGDILTKTLRDYFTDIDVYDNDIHLFQRVFTGPAADHGALALYRYFIEDTLTLAGTRCIQVSFTPNNPQDHAFSGTLYVAADTTFRIVQAVLNVPARSGVNFIDELQITLDYAQLPDGGIVLAQSDAVFLLSVADFFTKLQVRRRAAYADYAFAPIAAERFDFPGRQRQEPGALRRDAAFWQHARGDSLAATDRLDAMLTDVRRTKGFRSALFVLKLLTENFIETRTDPSRPNYVDIGPVNTLVSNNDLEGWRLRASAQTTALLHPRLFAKGYVAYGFRDHRWKGKAELTYSFKEKEYSPEEFPADRLTLTWQDDVSTPSDQFMRTDKDNVFTSLKWTTVEHFNYSRFFRLAYDREWGDGWRIQAQAQAERRTPALALFYQPLDGQPFPSLAGERRPHLRTTDLTLALIYQPGASWVNSKQRRFTTSRNAPRYELSHTVGVGGALGGDYAYHYTRLSLFRRFWFGSWGRVNTSLRLGAQWSQVPFPLLILPAANLSYLIETGTFSLIDNMEFLNDRSAELLVSWDASGKLLNRVPLLKRLKWREIIGCNVLWGHLTDKNNPAARPTDRRLFHFPGRLAADGSFTPLSRTMSSTPYVEAYVGLHNVFKFFHFQLVRRLTYLDRPGTTKWGVRMKVELDF